MYKSCNVVLLTTEKRSNIQMCSNDTLFWHNKPIISTKIGNGELYITSDEEIKEGDWCVLDLGENSRIVQVKSLNSGHSIFTVDIDDGYAQLSSLRKIIATTDTSLRRMGDDGIVDIALGLEISYIPESFIKYFIEEYNKGNVITDVLVEYEKILNPQWESYFEYTNYCMINGYSNQWYDKEILKVNYKDNNITIKKVKDSWNRKEHSKSLSDLGRDLSRTFNLPFKDSLEFTMKWIEENL